VSIAVYTACKSSVSVHPKFHIYSYPVAVYIFSCTLTWCVNVFGRVSVNTKIIFLHLHCFTWHKIIWHDFTLTCFIFYICIYTYMNVNEYYTLPLAQSVNKFHYGIYTYKEWKSRTIYTHKTGLDTLRLAPHPLRPKGKKDMFIIFYKHYLLKTSELKTNCQS
jgi:hypothetical protein